MSRPLLVTSLLIAGGIGLAALAPPAGTCAGSHVVVRGDTLSRIAWRCRSSVAAIARASGVADPDLIRVGQRLLIPGRTAAAEPAPAPRLAQAAPRGYRIRPADTLYSLARWARVPLPALLAANPGMDPRKIEIGDAVRLPSGSADPAVLRTRERGPLNAAPARAIVGTDHPLPPRRQAKPDEEPDTPGI
jgi:LysM repeat protein